MLESIDFGFGKIVHNQFYLTSDEPVTDSLHKLHEHMLTVLFPNKLVLEVGFHSTFLIRQPFFLIQVLSTKDSSIRHFEKKIYELTYSSLKTSIEEAINFASTWSMTNASLYMVFLENTEKTKDAFEIVVATSKEVAHQKAINRYKLYQTWHVYHTKLLNEMDGYDILVEKQLP